MERGQGKRRVKGEKGIGREGVQQRAQEGRVKGAHGGEGKGSRRGRKEGKGKR